MVRRRALWVGNVVYVTTRARGTRESRYVYVVSLRVRTAGLAAVGGYFGGLGTETQPKF